MSRFMFTLTSGEKVLILRKRKGLTQSGLARMVDASRLTINAVENERRPVSPDLLSRLAAALSVTDEILR